MAPPMNYVGSISILDRGDGPAQAILDRNARSLAKRVSDETKEELGKVMQRVQTIYGNYEWSTNLNESHPENDIFYLDTLAELEDLLQDPVKMKKYKKQVTIFVVGYENVCGQRLKLLQQVNEFFTDNASKVMDDEDSMNQTPDVDLDDMMDTIEDTLKHTKDLTNRLGDLNKEMVNYMYEYAQTKASNKTKKKLEKSLSQAREDVNNLNEKLLLLQQDAEEKEDRIQQMYKQIEVKSMEVQRYKTAAEVAKKELDEARGMKDQMAQQDLKVRELKQEIDRLRIELGESTIGKDLVESRLNNASLESQDRLKELEQQLEQKTIDVNQAKFEIQRLHEQQLEEISAAHRQEIEDLRVQHEEELKSLTVQVVELKNRLADVDEFEEKLSEANKHATLRAASADDAKRRLIETRVELVELQEEYEKKVNEAQALVDQVNKLEEDLKQKLKEPEVIIKEVEVVREVIKEIVKEVPVSDESSQNELKDKSGENTQVSSSESDVKLAPDTTETETVDPPASEAVADVEEEVGDDDSDETLEKLSKARLLERFKNHRLKSKETVTELQGQLETIVKKTKRKIDVLKGQFHEHKKHWELERNVLLDQVNQLQHLHTEAEEEADKAMAQLEELITEQEHMEIDEQTKLTEMEEFKREATLLEDEAREKLQQQIQEQQQLIEQQVKRNEELHHQIEGSEPADTQSVGHESPPGEDAATQVANTEVLDASVNAIVQMIEAAVQTLPDEQQELVQSITNMLTAEERLGPDQSNALDLLRAALLTTDAQVQTEQAPSDEALRQMKVRSMTLYTLASHLSHESLLLGVQPASVFETFASLFAVPRESDQEPVSDETLRQISSDISSAAKRISKSLSQLELSRYPTRATMGSEAVGLVETPYPLLVSKAVSAAQWRRSVQDVSVQYSPLPDQQTLDPRSASSLSNKSSADRHRSSLHEMRRSAEQRRSRTPTSLPPSRLSNMELNEEGDAPFPPDQPRPSSFRETATSVSLASVYDATTSDRAPSVVQTATSPFDFGPPPLLADHPIVQEFLKIYEGMKKFKEGLSSLFMDKDMTSYTQILMDIETLEFVEDRTVIPQVEEMASITCTVFEEILSVFKSVLSNDRDYPVSSLLALSRDPTRSMLLTGEKTRSLIDILPTLPQKPVSPSGRSSTASSVKYQLNDLQDKCQILESQLSEQGKQHEEQQKHNTVLMMEMQDTIHSLRRELAELSKEPPPQQVLPQESPPMMFTHHDAYRNARVLKKAVSRHKLDHDKYENAVEAMNRYVDIPAKRFVNLVNKYAHHKQMKTIEDNLKTSTAVDDDVMQILDKMERLQNERAERWAEEMDTLSHDRVQLASYLMVALDGIEQQTGIFLIKPIFSYKSRPIQPTYAGRTSQILRKHEENQDETRAARSPVPTPIRRSSQGERARMMPYQVPRSSDNIHKGIKGRRPQTMLQPSQSTWMPSQSSSLASDLAASKTMYQTPRILELDVNRMLYSQNQISLSIPPTMQSNDRLVNAANQSTRTFATLTRPSGRDGKSTGMSEHFNPPTTPQGGQTFSPAASPTDKRGSLKGSPYEDQDIVRNSLVTPPLPPINTAGT